MLEEALLGRLANWRPEPTDKTLTVAGADGAWSASLDAEAADTIGVRLNRLTVRPVSATVAAPLRQQADRLARDVTGLLEPLRVVEVADAAAQLRSQAPAAHNGGVAYYEVSRRGDGTTTLERYQARDGKRQAVPFSLTHDVLGKLVRDFAG